MTEVTFRSLDPCRDLNELRTLWYEYLTWGNDQLEAHYKLRLGDVEATVAADMAHLDCYAPPLGGLFLAELAGHLVGSVAVRPSGPGAAEIKRLYVRPTVRGRGIGRRLVANALRCACEAGYAVARLDSARFMVEAHAVYRQQGFVDVEPYSESEIPPDLWPHWVFMQCPIKTQTRD